jgi:hypothetical protein
LGADYVLVRHAYETIARNKQPDIVNATKFQPAKEPMMHFGNITDHDVSLTQHGKLRFSKIGLEHQQKVGKKTTKTRNDPAILVCLR